PLILNYHQLENTDHPILINIPTGVAFNPIKRISTVAFATDLKPSLILPFLKWLKASIPLLTAEVTPKNLPILLATLAIFWSGFFTFSQAFKVGISLDLYFGGFAISSAEA